LSRKIAPLLKLVLLKLNLTIIIVPASHPPAGSISSEQPFISVHHVSGECVKKITADVKKLTLAVSPPPTALSLAHPIFSLTKANQYINIP